MTFALGSLSSSETDCSPWLHLKHLTFKQFCLRIIVAFALQLIQSQVLRFMHRRLQLPILVKCFDLLYIQGVEISSYIIFCFTLLSSTEFLLASIILVPFFAEWYFVC